jgi:LPS-assembly protein
LTPTFGVRASRYGARVVDDAAAPGGKRVLNAPIRRVTEEVSLNLAFPSLQRVFERPQRRYKHVIEPEATYRYVNGVRSFEEFLRFDEEDVLTDTHEVEYSVTQRVFVKDQTDGIQARQFLSWRLSQKYYFDPDFRGALRPDARNVFTALNSLTGFAFADQPRRFSPITSVVKITPGGNYDTDFRLITRNSEILQPKANQVRLLASYGKLNRTGLNAAFGTTWDVRQDFLPNAIFQTSYNWDCCGVAFSYRRLGLGPLRSQNEFRFAFTIANVGTFGNIRRGERLF